MKKERCLHNPLLPGCYPDPSVCRAGDDYYMIASTFEYFPGIPIFHSKDFVNWHQIGHALTRPEQLDTDGLNPSRGIYASSIFYHEGRKRFYIITTLVGNAPYWDNVNFYIWAERPEGPWSDPIVVERAEGIDPSLVFDGDQTYYLGNLRPDPDHVGKGRHIWLQELDLDSGRLMGERLILREQGALTGAAAPEGPHIYHIGDWYYLLIAEGGTSYRHACTVFRSRSITGPYEGNPRNPVMTHRNLAKDYPIGCTGHADLIELYNGEWWAVLLACRTELNNCRVLGRETFAVPVTWEDEWPVFSPDTGHVEFTYPAPKLSEHTWEVRPCCDNFENGKLADCWITARTPGRPFYDLDARLGYLRLFLQPETNTGVKACSFLGQRQRHFSYMAWTKIEFLPEQDGAVCGLVLLLNNQYHIRFLYGMSGGEKTLTLIRRYEDRDFIISAQPWKQPVTYLRITARSGRLEFSFAEKPEEWTILADQVDERLVGDATGGIYTGTVIGLYASSGGQESSNYADIDWFEYQGID